MQMMKKGISLILLLGIIAGILAGCSSKKPEQFQTLKDFERATLGIITGSSYDPLAKEHFPQAERRYYSLMTDLVLATEQGKVDGYISEMPYCVAAIWEGAQIKVIEESLRCTDVGFIFQKDSGSPLCGQMNDFVTKARESGLLDQLSQKWFGNAEPAEHPEYASLTGENGTLRVAVAPDLKPVVYSKGDMLSGYEMEILVAFAKEYGYALDVTSMTFDAILPGVTSGKYDIGAGGINITEERKQSVDFSESHMAVDVVVVTKDDNRQPQKATLSDIEHATIGLVTGTNWDTVAQKKFPNAERMYFSSSADTILALQQGKVDTFFADKTVYAGMRWENSSISCIDEPIESISNALILAKEGYDEDLLAQINAFVAKTKADGTLAALDEKWFGDAEPAEHPDYTQLTGENGTLKIAIGDSMKPTAYQRGGFYTGYEVEFLTLFAEEYGYKLDMEGMAFDALIPSVTSGKCDIGACGITITPERTESVTFADTHFETYGVAVIHNESAGGATGRTLAEFENANLGVMTGTVYDSIAAEHFPNATREYYNLISDMIVAVEQGKIDAYFSESPYVTAAIWEGAKIAPVEEAIDHTRAAYIFQKSESSAKLRQQMDTFILEAKESGLLDELKGKWFGSTEPTEALDYDSLTGENGTLRIAVAPDLKPISYIKNDQLTGYEIELLVLFAKEYGYKLDVAYMTFDAILPGVITGKYDLGTGAVTITEERAQSLDFSESHLTVDVVLVVKAEDPSAAQAGFWSELKENFEKTFIREDRWKLIAEGMGVTILISICAAIAGTMLGLGLYMLSRSDRKLIHLLAKGFAKVYSRIIAGTPVVVILMILFYVIFGKVRDMSGIVVAIIGFTLTFGAFVYDHMTVSVGSVDHGQTEAAYALGYTKNKAFFRIVFPQAMKIFLPSYCGQAVELVKATAVVGYIAVNDLTKMGDIIRSNTYEAFFPLIATAVIYFLLTWILSLLLKLVKRRFEPKRRSAEDILKGVKSA